jgi:hypothetical protein
MKLVLATGAVIAAIAVALAAAPAAVVHETPPDVTPAELRQRDACVKLLKDGWPVTNVAQHTTFLRSDTLNIVYVNRDFKWLAAAHTEFMRKHDLTRYGHCLFHKDGTMSMAHDDGVDGTLRTTFDAGRTWE